MATSLATLQKIRLANQLGGYEGQNAEFGDDSQTLEQGVRHNVGDLNTVLQLNNDYIGAYDQVGSDIQYYYDNHYKGTDDINSFVNAYNSNIDTINNPWAQTDVQYNTKGLTRSNELYSQMYHSRSFSNGQKGKGYIGYDSTHQDVLGSSTWLRNSDIYEKDWNSLTDEERHGRTFNVKIQGKDYKVGKDWQGKLVLLNEETEPEKEQKKKYSWWSDWVPIGMQWANEKIANLRKYINDTKQKVPLDTAQYKVFKTTSNYAQRQQAENTKNIMASATANAASNVNDWSKQQNIIYSGYQKTLDALNSINNEYTKANQYNITNGTETSNYNTSQDITTGNINNQRLTGLHNTLLGKKNEWIAADLKSDNDAINAFDASLNKFVQTERQNESWRKERQLYNQKISDQNTLNNQYTEAVQNINYDPKIVGDAINNILKGRTADGSEISDKYYANDLTEADLLMLEQAYYRLMTRSLTAQDKALIDKVIAIDNPYNKSLFAGISQRQKEYYNVWDKQSNAITDRYNKGIEENITPYITGQYIPVFRKKGGSLNSSIVTQAMKTFQKNQENDDKKVIKSAESRLKRMEKELDRLHKKEILILKQLYK